MTILKGSDDLKIIKNQIVYQCEYCGKRLLSKNGSKIHEEQYCKKNPNVILKCNHEWHEKWIPIHGEEYRYQPEYTFCIHCGIKDYELEELETENSK